MAHTLCTFNVNNLFVRYRFGQKFPGDMGSKSLTPDPAFGYLPVYDPDLFQIFNEKQRKLAVRALTNDGQSFPDIICLQEVESLIALRKFNEDKNLLNKRYRYALLIDSRDFRQIDVAILSKLPILSVRSNMEELDPVTPDGKKKFLFSRDCLEVVIALNKSGSRTLTLFINHLKSKFAMTPAERQEGDELRERQVRKVLEIVHRRFPDTKFDTELSPAVGDLNDEPLSKPVQPLVSGSGLVDPLKRIPKQEDRWTHWFRSANNVSQLDYLLLSPALAAATAGKIPRIERRGISFSHILSDLKPGPKRSRFERKDNDPNPIPIDFRFERFPEVNNEDYASDHCPVFLEIP